MTEQTNWASYIYKFFAVILIIFSLYTAAFGVFPDVIQRGTHLALAIILVRGDVRDDAARLAPGHGLRAVDGLRPA